MTAGNHKETEQKILELMRDAVKFDEELRAKYQIGNKFRFVRDRLHGLLTHLEEMVAVPQTQEITSAPQQRVADDMLVYVYLYNAHGMTMRSWQKLLTPKVMMEYSVNRPIYSEKSHVESMIKSKSNIAQHAYLTFAVNPSFILSTGASKDPNDFPLIKMRERSLEFHKLISFTHGFQEYSVDEQGELKKK